MQNIQHIVQRFLLECAQSTDILAFFNAVLTQHQRLCEEAGIFAIAFHVSTLHHAFFALQRTNQRQAETRRRLAH
ncbi:hypothetical protein D3C78_1385440 [compost metagenome]